MRPSFGAALVALGAISAVLGCTAGPELRLQDRWRKDAIVPGTSREGLLRVMGTELVTIYDTDGAVRRVLPNPYEVRAIQYGDRAFEVIVYFTNPKPKDGPVAEEELTPFVLEHGRVIGRGWHFLRGLTAAGNAGSQGGPAS